MSKQCKFSDCYQVVSPIHEFCVDHFEWAQSGDVDDCPICTKGKFVRHPLCNNCSQKSGDSQQSENTKLATIQLLTAVEDLLTVVKAETLCGTEERRQLLSSLEIAVERVRRELQFN